MKLIESINMKIEKRKEYKRGKAWSLYIDLKSAFDSVDHTILFKRMKYIDVPKRLINTISWLYCQTKFRVGQDNVDINRGVIQGGVLSPTLFLIMFNDLIKELKEKKLEALAYADDLAIVGVGKQELKKAITTIER